MSSIVSAPDSTLVEAAQPLGPTDGPATRTDINQELPELRELSASDAIFDLLRDRGTPSEHQLRGAHRAVFDIVAEGVHREEQQVCMYMRTSQVWLLRGALAFLLDQKNQKLLQIFETLPDDAQARLIGVAEGLARQASERTVTLDHQDGTTAYTPPPLPPKDGDFKRLPERVRMSAQEVIAYAREVWGPWLKACHPSLPCDAMSRQDLLERDPRLYYRLQAMRDVGGLGSVFQTKSQRLDAHASHALETAAGSDPKDLRTLAARLAQRGYRARRRAPASEQTAAQDIATSESEA